VLGELESVADRLSEWLQTHIALVSAAIATLLVVAGVGAWIASWRQGAEEAASSALADARADYLAAMGAEPGAIEVPQLANPAAAQQIRADFEKRFATVAEEHTGTVAGALAVVERAGLATAGGRSDEAITLLEKALQDSPKNDAVRGLIGQRLAQRFEDAGSGRRPPTATRRPRSSPTIRCASGRSPTRRAVARWRATPQPRALSTIASIGRRLSCSSATSSAPSAPSCAPLPPRSAPTEPRLEFAAGVAFGDICV
jgi:hypothetical protein